ncbi:uncharacterized protein LOC131180718 [Hevea brasiliensis]|uniref:uncharacterized protein LOC131180718 n=1 Tax=Hevea brasiliensis TaxID=3981 RepID=UPI0025E79B0D|nr:uncharacterized protein LOC131180718 [Hevea brasiliensis]
MSIPSFATLYWDGEIIMDDEGYEYYGGSSTVITIGKRMNFGTLGMKIVRGINLKGGHEVISKILFRQPIEKNGSFKWDCMGLANDDDVNIMFNFIDEIGGMSSIELYIDIFRPSANVVDEAGPSNSCYTEALKCTDDFESASNDYCPDDDEDDAESDEEWIDSDDWDMNEDGGHHNELVVDLPFYYNTHVANPIMPLVPPPPYSEIDFSLLTVDPWSTPQCSSMWDPLKEFELEMIFSSREDVQKAAKEYHLHRHHEFCNEETKSRTYAIRCKDTTSNCKWRLRASRGKGSDIWKITRYSGPHTCVNPSLSQDHKQLDSIFISDFILAIVREQPNVKIGALQSEIKDKIGYMPSYRKTWKARHDAIIKIFGDWDESYGRLRQFMLALCKQNPESMFFIEDDPFFVNNRLDPAYRVFDRMFWAYKQTIEGFKNCRPVIFIDSTFLYGKYKGCLFCATTLDGNNHIFPIAWAIVDSENTRNWDWFMSCLRVFVTDRKGICVISDRHIAIKKAMNQDWWQPPDGHHRYCLRHIISNYNTNTTIGKKKIYEAMNTIKNEHPDTFEWATKIPLEKWTRSHDGGKRYGSMTTNTVESVNGILKGIRALPITAMVEKIFFQCVDYFDTRCTTLREQLQMGFKFTPACRQILLDNLNEANSYNVRIFNRDCGEFEVWKGRSETKHVVKLDERICTCKKFEEICIPCSHVIAACQAMSINYEQTPMSSLFAPFGRPSSIGPSQYASSQFGGYGSDQYYALYQSGALGHIPSGAGLFGHHEQGAMHYTAGGESSGQQQGQPGQPQDAQGDPEEQQEGGQHRVLRPRRHIRRPGCGT